MKHEIRAYSQTQLGNQDAVGMYHLRYEVFVERLAWMKAENGLERDQFDDIAQGVVILAKSQDGVVDACARILPTTGPYMLRDIFPELLHGQELPMSSDCWELSRFAVATNRTATSHASFGPISKAVMIETANFAIAKNINRYVIVTTPVMERMLRQQGLHIHRIGAPMRMGVAFAVACMIEMDRITLNSLGIDY